MRGRQAVAVIGGLCLVVAGWGRAPKPTALAKPTASTSPSASPTPPVMPAAAKEKTKAGAVAFVRHYIDALNFAQSTGKVETLAELESSTCGSCKSVRDDLSKLYQSGGHLKGGQWSISQII